MPCFVLHAMTFCTVSVFICCHVFVCPCVHLCLQSYYYWWEWDANACPTTFTPGQYARARCVFECYRQNKCFDGSFRW
jgi:hypothetical protein